MAVVDTIPVTLAKTIGLAGEAQARAWADDNGTWIREVIDKHKQYLLTAEVHKHQAAYDGFLEEIDQRDKSRGDDTNHKLQVNYAQLFIDTVVDYMLGNPISWTIEDQEKAAPQALVDEYKKAVLKYLNNKEHTQRVFSEVLRQGCLGGYHAVIFWVDEKGKIDYEEYPINEVVPVYDTRGRLQLVLRYYLVDEVLGDKKVSRTKVEVYDEKYRTDYISDETGQSYTLDEEGDNPVEHFAGRIPVVLYVNGAPASYEKRLERNGVSDLANGLYSVLLNLAETMSDKANTVDYSLDQYLLLVGVDTDEDEVVKMRKARALTLASNESDARFIAQTQDDALVEHHIDRLLDVAHDMAQVPQLNNLSGATATEIKLKYAALDIKAGKKEIHFTETVKRFVQVLTDLLNAQRLVAAGVEDVHAVLAGDAEPPASVQLYSAEWVDFTIKRNLPQNYQEIANIVGTLIDKVPDIYLYELLWFIPDPVAALEEMKKQKDEAAKREVDLAKAQGLGAMGLDNMDGNQN